MAGIPEKQKMKPFETQMLPDELWLQTLKYLPALDLAQVVCVNKHLCRIAQDKLFLLQFHSHEDWMFAGAILKTMLALFDTNETEEREEKEIFQQHAVEIQHKIALAYEVDRSINIAVEDKIRDILDTFLFLDKKITACLIERYYDINCWKENQYKIFFLDKALREKLESQLNFTLDRLVALLQKPDCQLTTISLVLNDIGAEGAKALAATFASEHCKVTYIDFFGSNIGYEGAKALAATLASEHCKLTSIDLALNCIGDEGAKILARALVERERLGFPACTIEGVKKLSEYIDKARLDQFGQERRPGCRV